MLFFIRLRRLLSLLALFSMGAAIQPAALARSRKGDKLMQAGKDAEIGRDYAAALQFYEQALKADPKDGMYQILVQRSRMVVSQMLVQQGLKARSAGQLEDARDLFMKALQLDSASSIAASEWRRTIEMIETATKRPEAERALTPAEIEMKRTEERISRLAAPPELRPVSRQIQSLKMNNQPVRVLYETVCKLVGLNVIFDPQFQTTSGKNYNVDLSNSSVDDALEYIGVLTKTFWKPISSNTIFIAEDNVTKRRDYDDDVLKVLYVQNASSVQEFQEVVTAVRSVLEVRRVFSYNAQKAMVIRGSSDAVALAEKLIRDLDKPKAEVIVDVILLEANKGRVRDLAAALTPAGINQAISYVPGVSSSTSTDSSTTSTTTAASATAPPLLLSQLGISTNQFATSLPSALLQALVTDRNSRLIQSPQVRASDGQKVVLHIGDRVPIATGSFQPGFGGVGAGVSPLVSTQFQLLEVGVKVEITPQVHGTDEVTLKLNMEVSQVREYVELGGIRQPVIGQRRSEAELRLRNGEVNILGGLSSSQDSRTRSGIPGIIDVPVLNRLFSSENVEKTQQELLIALIPRIIRTPGYTANNLRTVGAGSDQVVRVRYSPAEEDPAVKPVSGSITGGETAKPVTPQPPSPEPPKTPAEKPLPAGSPTLTFSPAGDIETQLGSSVMLGLMANQIQDLVTADPVRIRFNPQLLRLNDVVIGDLLTRDGTAANISKDIRNESGEVTISLSRASAGTGQSGTGTLCTLVFSAIGRGSAPVMVEGASLMDSKQQPIVASTTARAGVRIQ